MKKLFYLFCAGALLFSGGCSDDGAWNASRIAFADIVDAECLYITGTSTTRASDEVSPSALFKITFDGSTEKVVFTDENGKHVDVKVKSFRRLFDQYIHFYLLFPTDYNYYIPGQVLIRRSDGAAFKFDPQAFVNYTDSIIDEDTLLQTDSADNIYLQPGNFGPLFKIFTDGNGVGITQISRDNMRPGGWLVDRRGNVLIDSEYIRLASGEFALYSIPPVRISGGCSYYDLDRFYAWNDSEGFYHCVSVNPSDHTIPPFTRIEYCRPTSLTSAFEVIKTFQCYGDFIPLVYTDKTVLFEIGGKYRVDIYNKDHIELHEMEPRPLPDGIEFEYYGQKYPHTERYLYGKSESEIWRLSVETGVPEMLYKYDDEFVIKSMTVRNDIVTFTAFELRRGNDVVAEIYPDKTVKVLESTNGDKIIYFERLN